MTKAAFNALITEFSIDTDHFPGTDLVQKEGRVGLAIISDPAGDLWHLFIDNKPVKVQIVDKESSFDFTEMKVERRRKFSIRLKHGVFCCHVCVQYYINGKYHHDRCHEYQNITPDTIERLYDPDKALSRSDPEFGFVLVSNVERTDLLCNTVSSISKDEQIRVLSEQIDFMEDQIEELEKQPAPVFDAEKVKKLIIEYGKLHTLCANTKRFVVNDCAKMQATYYKLLSALHIE